MRQIKYETRGSLYMKLSRTKTGSSRTWLGGLKWNAEKVGNLLVRAGYLKPMSLDRWDWIKPVDEKVIEDVIGSASRSRRV